MIRLTETDRSPTAAEIRIEGNLDEQALDVIAESLREHARAGLLQVRLQADGIVSVDVRALRRWSWEPPPRVTLHTTRRALHDQLDVAGVEAVLHEHTPTPPGREAG